MFYTGEKAPPVRAPPKASFKRNRARGQRVTPRRAVQSFMYTRVLITSTV